ncbi:MAG TPA: DNA methyltransferase [Chthoniobacter sp.]
MSGFREELAAFSEFGARTVVTEHDCDGSRVPVFENEFWTAKQRAGHSLQEISYRACFKPQLPAFFISRFTSAGDAIYDPFMGRGTTLVEASLLGRRPVGNDVNPLSRVLVQPRLTPPSLEAISKRLDEIPLDTASDTPDDLLVFYHPDTLREIGALRSWFLQRRESGELDDLDRWLQMVATNRLTGHSPGFFSVYTLPPNQATSVTAQRKINAKRNQTPEYRDVRKLMLRKSRQLLKDPLPAKASPASSLHTGSAAHTPGIESASVALIVTSPPFLDIVQYKQDNWLRAWFCGIDLDQVDVWTFRKLSDWSEAMKGAFSEFLRVLRPTGVMAFEVGEVRKGSVRLEDEVVRVGLATGFIPECILINSQVFTKTANCWGVDNNERGTNSNRIVVFRKPA